MKKGYNINKRQSNKKIMHFDKYVWIFFRIFLPRSGFGIQSVRIQLIHHMRLLVGVHGYLEKAYGMQQVVPLEESILCTPGASLSMKIDVGASACMQFRQTAWRRGDSDSEFHQNKWPSAAIWSSMVKK
jgi:hypothetical protein